MCEWFPPFSMTKALRHTIVLAVLITIISSVFLLHTREYQARVTAMWNSWEHKHMHDTYRVTGHFIVALLFHT